MAAQEFKQALNNSQRAPGSLDANQQQKHFLGFNAKSLRRMRKGIPLVLLVVGASVLVSRIPADASYWRKAWDQQTLFPASPDACGCADCAGIDSACLTCQTHVAVAQQGIGFDLSELSVPGDEIFSGGPPKDGIPALTNPEVLAAEEAGYLRPEDRIIGLHIDRVARAYPLKILNYHEIVNDQLAGVPVAIVYCPLCDSATIFDRRTPLGEKDFGVSGLLYNSNVLMFDRDSATESLWSQVMGEGISGPGLGHSLATLPIELTTWSDWKARYPATTVLSNATGHQRDYSVNPYAEYLTTPGLMFPAQPTSNALNSKQRVLGVWNGQSARAYSLADFGEDSVRVEDHLNGNSIVLQYDADTGSLRVVEAEEGVQWMYAFWFAWHAFRPETEIFVQ